MKLELVYDKGIVERYNTSETESAKKAFYKFKHALSENGFDILTDNMPVKVRLLYDKGYVIDEFCPESDEKLTRANAIGTVNNILYRNLCKCLGQHYYGRIIDRIQDLVVPECLNECKGDYRSITEDDIANITGKAILNIIEKKEDYAWNLINLKRDLGALLVALQKDPLIDWDNCKKLKCMPNLEAFVRKDF